MGEVVAFERTFDGYNNPEIQRAARLVTEHEAALQKIITAPKRLEDERQREFAKLKAEIETELMADGVE